MQPYYENKKAFLLMHFIHFYLDYGNFHTREAKKSKSCSEFDLCLVTSRQVTATARRVNWPRLDIRPVPPPRRVE